MHLFLCEAVWYVREIIFCNGRRFGLHFEFELEIVAIVRTFPVLSTPRPVTSTEHVRMVSLLLS